MFGRLANIFRGFLSLFIKDLEKRNPEALLELESENLRKQIGSYNQGLAGHAGLAERLMGQSLKGAINDMRMKSAVAEMSEMAAGMIGQIGGSGDTLNRLHEMVEEERDKAAGRARVARDAIDMSDINLKEAEMTALADQALAIVAQAAAQ